MKIWRVEIADTIPPVGKLFDKGTPVVRKFTLIDYGDSNSAQLRRKLEVRYGKERVIHHELGE